MTDYTSSNIILLCHAGHQLYRRGLEMQDLIDGEVRPNYEPLALEKRNTESI